MSAERVAQLNREIAARSAELVELLAGEESAPSNDAEPPPWLTIERFAARLGISARTVRRLIAEGMPSQRVRPRAIRIPVAKAEVWIAEREQVAEVP